VRIGIIADIHANLPAFEVVLARLKEQDASDRLWCLGDVVGYGPYPNECLDLLRTYAHICVPGNHDWGVIGRTERVIFNDAAGFVLDWTAQQLTPTNRAYLEKLPEVIKLPIARMTLLHASPRDPIWEYVVEAEEAARCYPFFQTRHCLMGHTHLPLVFRRAADGTVTVGAPEAGQAVRLGQERLMLNPGSVGQPRNGDPRAHYAIYDSNENQLIYQRVEYPIAQTQARMRELKFPVRLIERLARGE
jgi:predicted phosphodiesterase